VNIAAIITTQGPEAIKNVSIELNRLTKDGNVVVRLDHLYPTTVYYTDRRVLASPDGAGDSKLKSVG